MSMHIPEIWAHEMNLQLRKRYVATPVFNTNFQGEIEGGGSVVKIFTPGSVTIGDYVSGSDMNVQTDPQGSELELTIDQQKSFNFTIDDVKAKQSVADLLNTYADEAAYGLRDVAEQHIFKTIAEGAAPANVKTLASGLSASTIYDEIAALKKILSKNRVPLEGRSLFVSPDEIELLESSDEFKAASDMGDEVKRNGFAGRVCGFDVFETLNLKEEDPAAIASGDPVHRFLVASVSRATTHAEQIVKVKQFEPEKQFAQGVKGLHVYGTKVIKPTAIAVLKTKFDEGTMV